MENVKSFLESSSIHGVAYIATTKKNAVRIFWIVVVLSGFTTACHLIYQSFNNWSENPIATTIETRPINEIKYPTITVCPPKNTYTNLNHDIMAVGNMTYGHDLVDENSEAYWLQKSFLRHFQHKDFEEMLGKINMFHEEDKYSNWYNEINQIPIQVLKDNVFVDNSFTSYAPSGSISTPYFGEKFDEEKFHLSEDFKINIGNPYIDTDGLENFGNRTYKFKYDVVENLEYIRIGSGNSAFILDPKKNEFDMIQDIDARISFHRKFQQSDFEDWKMKRMTGFSVQWEYIGDKYEKIRPKATGKLTNKNFIPFRNFGRTF